MSVYPYLYLYICMYVLPPQWLIQTGYMQGKDPSHDLAAHFSFSSLVAEIAYILLD